MKFMSRKSNFFDRLSHPYHLMDGYTYPSGQKGDKGEHMIIDDEKFFKMGIRTPRKPRTASIVVCNLLTHRNLASRTGRRKNENDPQKAQNAQ